MGKKRLMHKLFAVLLKILYNLFIAASGGGPISFSYNIVKTA